MPVVAIIIPVIWVGFWIYWLVAATQRKATRRSSGAAGPVRVAIIVLVLVGIRTGVFRGPGAIHQPWLEGTGLAVFLAGLAWAVWARIFLGRNWGSPMSERVDPELVTSGPYRYVRHPIYSGIIVAMVGTAMAISPYYFLAVALLSVYFVYSATIEERNMERVFPDTYPPYRRSTKMLVPFVF